MQAIRQPRHEIEKEIKIVVLEYYVIKLGHLLNLHNFTLVIKRVNNQVHNES